MGLRNSKKIVSAVFIINLIAIVSAYGWGSWGYYSSPSDLLQNEWVMFAGIFILFFAIVFFAVSKTFKENKGAAIVVALVVSLFISMAVVQRGWLYSYAGEEIGSWALVIALLLIIGLIIKLMNDVFGRFGAIIAVIGLWISLFFIDPYYFIPSGDIGDIVLTIYESAKGILGFIVVVIAVVLLYKFGSKPESWAKEIFKKRRW